MCELSRSGFGTHRILYGPRVRVHVARRGEAHKASCKAHQAAGTAKKKGK